MIKATSNIMHNGTLYEAGSVFEADEAAEKKLIEAGSAVKSDGKEEVTPKVAAVKAKVVAGEKPNADWTKVKLLGYARNLGVTADQTLNKKEILKLIENAPVAPPVAEGEVPAVTVNENAPVTPVEPDEDEKPE